MRIRRFAGLNGVEIGFVTVLGIVGGIYIWKPIFEKSSPKKEQAPLEDAKQS